MDEAQRVAQWDHDFRPDYLHLAQAHRDLGSPPILAMTATAPPRVRHDIERHVEIACELATECERLRAELAELRRFRKAIMDYDSNLYDALADSDAAHKGEGE